MITLLVVLVVWYGIGVAIGLAMTYVEGDAVMIGEIPGMLCICWLGPLLGLIVISMYVDDNEVIIWKGRDTKGDVER